MDIILDKIWVLLYDMNPLNFVYKLIPENKWLPRDNCTVTEQLNREKKKVNHFPRGIFLHTTYGAPKSERRRMSALTIFPTIAAFSPPQDS